MNLKLATLLLALLLTQPAAAQDWPTWAGPGGDFRVDAGAIPKDAPVSLKVAWRQKIGPAYSAVVVGGGLAITTYSDETNDFVAAFDAESGARKWAYTIGPAYLGHYGSQSGPSPRPSYGKGNSSASAPRAASSP